MRTIKILVFTFSCEGRFARAQRGLKCRRRKETSKPDTFPKICRQIPVPFETDEFVILVAAEPVTNSSGLPTGEKGATALFCASMHCSV